MGCGDSGMTSAHHALHRCWTLTTTQESEAERAVRERKRQEQNTVDGCTMAREFIASLEFYEWSDDARAAVDLQHRLRAPTLDALQAALLFLSGVHPARPGQTALVRHIQEVVRPRTATRELHVARAMAMRQFVNGHAPTFPGPGIGIPRPEKR